MIGASTLPPRHASMLAMRQHDLLLIENVAYLVEELHLATRAQLASAAGVTVQNIGMLIRGQNKSMTPDSLIKTAKFFGLTAEDLVQRDLRSERWGTDAHAPPSSAGEFKMPPGASSDDAVRIEEMASAYLQTDDKERLYQIIKAFSSHQQQRPRVSGQRHGLPVGKKKPERKRFTK